MLSSKLCNSSLSSMAARCSTLFTFSAITAMVGYKTYCKSAQQAALEDDLKATIKRYLQKVCTLSSSSKHDGHGEDKKQLIREWRAQINKFESQCPAAAHILFREFGQPSNNELGDLVLQMLSEWNNLAYDALCDHIEQITTANSKQEQLAILELGPGSGDGMHKIYTRMRDKVRCVHAFDVSQSAISSLHSRFAAQIRENKICIEHADIAQGSNDASIHRILTQNPRTKYDIIFHFNCFYFWHNLPVCGNVLAQLLAEQGFLIGGFRWKYLARCDPQIFKNRKPSEYVDMLQQAQSFDMHSLNIIDQVGGDENYQIIAIQRK